MTLDSLHQLIIDFIEKTNRPIFLTGKAGTGKTTFLRYIRTHITKNLAVVAPTAVAAINAGGVTIHSFFQVPFGPTLPTLNGSAFLEFSGTSFSPEKSKLIKCLDLLIIDEISMVRADTLDYIDRILRFVKGNQQPFGGIQLLMIGDLYQLSPVYQQDWHLLKKYYAGPYFFNSLAFNQQPILTFELTKVHRQKDPGFIELLNDIRSGSISEPQLEKLNEHYKSIPESDQLSEYVTLTTHNPLVKQINEVRLHELSGTAHHFKAVVTGDFPADAFPTEEELILKEGALVMFIRNDSSGKKQFYNGRTAKISNISGNTIKVIFLDDHTEFEVGLEVWENTKYALSEADQKVTESSAGSFSQYPIRLAWAITIHKSQGLTFEKAIIDVGAAFAHGQTYVALSRCRSLEGLILKEKVKAANIITDPAVTNFMNQAQSEVPDQQTLTAAVSSLAANMLTGIFDFSNITDAWNYLKQVIANGNLQTTELEEKAESVQILLDEKIRKIADRFIRQELNTATDHLNLDSIIFKERLTKAAAYFLPNLTELSVYISNIHLLRSNATFDPAYFPTLNLLLEQVETKIELFKLMPTAKSNTEIIATIKNAALAFQSIDDWKTKEVKKEEVIENPALYAALENWRIQIAAKRQSQTYNILSDQALVAISAKLPRSLKQLSMIKNFGEGKTAEFGEEILKIIRMHLGENELF